MSIGGDENIDDAINEAPVTNIGQANQDAMLQISNNLVLITKTLQETITAIPTTLAACSKQEKAIATCSKQEKATKK